MAFILEASTISPRQCKNSHMRSMEKSLAETRFGCNDEIMAEQKNKKNVETLGEYYKAEKTLRIVIFF